MVSLNRSPTWQRCRRDAVLKIHFAFMKAKSRCLKTPGSLAVLCAFLMVQAAFGQSPTLINIITNPTPASVERFGGDSVALGNDRVVVGATGAGTLGSGEAYLYNTNGTLLATFTNPTPDVNEYFGSALAVVATSRVLIGAPYDSAGAPGAGSAYLFGTNGVLVRTFTNPIPGTNDLFGISVAAVG